MSGVQMFLTIGALILLSLLVLNVNRIIISAQTNEIKNEALMTAASIAETAVNEVAAKAFDQSVISRIVIDTALLKSPNAFGPETGEVYPNYNDVDDYNNYTRNDSTPRLGVYSIKIKVNYVSDANAKTESFVKSRTKLISAFVYNTVLADTFKLYRYKCY